MLLLLLACTPEPADTGPHAAPWTAGLSRLDAAIGPWSPRRGIAHLHSPYSHDACDGEGLIDGAPNEPCLADLRAALCTTSQDFAFLTDHPAYMAYQPFEDLLLARGNDRVIESGGSPVANAIACEGGGTTLLMPGFEDELMPLGLERHAEGSIEERETAYNLYTGDEVQALRAQGGLVFLAHPEGRDRDEMLALQEAGLTGMEAFNLHAMVDPDIRGEDLGLDPWGWTSAIAPFTHPDSDSEPDLLFLAFFEEQTPTLAHWDAMSAARQGGPTPGIGGTDAHQNVLDLPLRDGERVDSYRRMIRWFDNWLLVDPTAGPDEPAALKEALAAGRSLVVFEVLGTPQGLDIYLDADGQRYDMGSDAPAGTLHVDCPTLASGSPRGEEIPEVSARIFRDGVLIGEGCGSHDASAPGVYRATIDIVPHHLAPFLTDVPELSERSFPWIYGNPIRVSGD